MKPERIKKAPGGGYRARDPGKQPSKRSARKDIPPRGTGTSWNPNGNGIERVLEFYRENPQAPLQKAAEELGLSRITINSYRSKLIQEGLLERLN